MENDSEQLVTQISANVFFREFTFNKNQFKTQAGELELADNVLWLDDLLFIIQVKERNRDDVKTSVEENKWLHKVIKQAKIQIKDSLTFLDTYHEIKIRNLRQHEIPISKPDLSAVNKVIVYAPNSDLITEENRFLKIYESSQVGNVHVFHVEDYLWVCKYLITPTELDEYLKFRERIFLKHKAVISNLPEQYVLGHFLNTDDECVLDPKYIEALNNVNQNTVSWDMSGIINSFTKDLRMPDGSKPDDYYAIIKQIAKLKRFEVKGFKERFIRMIDEASKSKLMMPYRYTIPRTGCGFVFIPLTKERTKQWKNALVNFTAIYQYKRKLKKCLGVCASKEGDYFDINWTYIEKEWEFNEAFEEAVKRDAQMYGAGKAIELGRYEIDDDGKTEKDSPM